jgi:hypothetical protein
LAKYTDSLVLANGDFAKCQKAATDPESGDALIAVLSQYLSQILQADYHRTRQHRRPTQIWPQFVRLLGV